MSLTREADTDSAHGFLQESGKCEALFVMDNALREKNEEVA
jgi:hypothetical protein